MGYPLYPTPYTLYSKCYASNLPRREICLSLTGIEGIMHIWQKVREIITMILFQGSGVYGGIDKYSDVDLLVVTNKTIPIRSRIKKISSIAEVVRNTGEKFKDRDMFFYKGMEFNIQHIRSVKEIMPYDIFNSKIIYNPKKEKHQEY